MHCEAATGASAEASVGHGVQAVAPSSEYVLPTHVAHAVGLGCGSAKWPARHCTSLVCDAHANPTRQGRQLVVPLRM